MGHCPEGYWVETAGLTITGGMVETQEVSAGMMLVLRLASVGLSVCISWLLSWTFWARQAGEAAVGLPSGWAYLQGGQAIQE